MQVPTEGITRSCVFSSAVGAVSVGDKLFVCGGFDGVSSLETVECYDPDSDRWTMAANMKKHR